MLLTECKPRIKEVTNGALTNAALITVRRTKSGNIRLVVGANYLAASACVFSKNGLTELIEELTAVRDAMKDK